MSFKTEKCYLCKKPIDEKIFYMKLHNKVIPICTSCFVRIEVEYDIARANKFYESILKSK